MSGTSPHRQAGCTLWNTTATVYAVGHFMSRTMPSSGAPAVSISRTLWACSRVKSIPWSCPTYGMVPSAPVVHPYGQRPGRRREGGEGVVRAAGKERPPTSRPVGTPQSASCFSGDGRRLATTLFQWGRASERNSRTGQGQASPRESGVAANSPACPSFPRSCPLQGGADRRVRFWGAAPASLS